MRILRATERCGDRYFQIRYGKAIDRVIKVNKKRLRDQSIVNMLAKELNSMEKGISNLLSAIEQGMVTSFTKKRLAELEGRKECSRKPFKCSFTSKKAKEKSELNTFQVFNSLSLG